MVQASITSDSNLEILPILVYGSIVVWKAAITEQMEGLQ